MAPAGPMNGRPALFSCGPGASPTITSRMFSGTGSAVVYMPPGVDSAPVKQALERSAHALHKAIMLAARGMSYSKIVARQTCYRPTNP